MFYEGATILNGRSPFFLMLKGDQMKKEHDSVCERLRSPEEMANILNVKTSWIYRQTMKHGPGTMPRIKMGKYLRFEPDKVIAWIKGQQDAE